jgi:hypothetical protein
MMFTEALTRLRGAWEEDMRVGVVERINSVPYEKHSCHIVYAVSSMGKCVYEEARDTLWDIKEGLEEERNEVVMIEMPVTFSKVDRR